MGEAELKAQINALEAQVAEYQYQLGERERPIQEIDLKEYLDDLAVLEKLKKLEGNKVIVTGAKVGNIGINRDPFLLWPIRRLYADIADSSGKVTRFYYAMQILKHSKEEKIEDIVKQAKKSEAPLIVNFHRLGGIALPLGDCYHLVGVVEDKPIYFDDL